MCALVRQPKWPLNIICPPGLAADRGSNYRIIESQKAAGGQGFNIAACHHIADVAAAKIEVIADAVIGVPGVWPQ
jgi:hypothetical protein